jgi:hypothetical protein
LEVSAIPFGLSPPVGDPLAKIMIPWEAISVRKAEKRRPLKEHPVSPQTMTGILRLVGGDTGA